MTTPEAGESAPVFTPEQQAWIENLILSRTAPTAPASSSSTSATAASSSTTPLHSAPGNLGEFPYTNTIKCDQCLVNILVPIYTLCIIIRANYPSHVVARILSQLIPIDRYLSICRHAGMPTPCLPAGKQFAQIIEYICLLDG